MSKTYQCASCNQSSEYSPKFAGASAIVGFVVFKLFTAFLLPLSNSHPAAWVFAVVLAASMWFIAFYYLVPLAKKEAQ